MALTSMKLTKSEVKKEFGVQPTVVGADDRPRYPYGLEITLDAATLDKLKIETLPQIGKTVTLTAEAFVTRVTVHVDDTDNRTVGLQIVELAVADKGT